MNKPSLAIGVRQLLNAGTSATLATQSLKHPGFPFASVVPYALDKAGNPVLLLSSMATHSKNLRADARATLLVAGDSADLAEARASVVGTVAVVDDARRESVSKLYLEKNPQAAAWVSFGDFAFYQMEIVEIYFIAGFGAMGWVTADDYGNA